MAHRVHRSVVMATNNTKERPFGKPTIGLDNHAKNVGQRESCHSVGRGGKPTISPETHDANYGQRDPIDEEEEFEVVTDIEESRGERKTGDDIEESRGQRGTDSDVEGARGGRDHGEDFEPYIGENGVLSDDREVE